MLKHFVLLLVWPLNCLAQSASDGQLMRAQKLFKAKDYLSARSVIDSVVATPPGTYDFVAWTLRAFIYFEDYKKTDKALLHSDLREIVLSSVMRSMKLSPDYEYGLNNKRLLNT